MFTGIIDHTGLLQSVVTTEVGMRISIMHAFPDLCLGESIAVNGICLTVTDFDERVFYCDVSPETLGLTTARDFKVGNKVHLERALQLSSRLGGHMVMGHVDQTVVVLKRIPHHDYIELQLGGLQVKDLAYVVKKGSVSLDGVSLTVNETSEQGFSVLLIPHTLQITHLADLVVGQAVNIEFDMMTRIIVEQCRKVLSRG